MNGGEPLSTPAQKLRSFDSAGRVECARSRALARARLAPGQMARHTDDTAHIALHTLHPSATEPSFSCSRRARLCFETIVVTCISLFLFVAVLEKRHRICIGLNSEKVKSRIYIETHFDYYRVNRHIIFENGTLKDIS